ncbi:MAG: hypothetical protein Q4E55_04930 [Bacteroidales bacterium]|nr:hypothetical protein [Bacteroidales bacterium]
MIAPDEIDQLGEGIEGFHLPQNIAPGEVLVRHPDKRGYIQVTEAENEYLRASVDDVCLAAQWLGAKKVKYQRCEVNEYRRIINAGGSIGYDAIGIGINIGRDETQRWLNSYCLTREYDNQQNFTMEQFNSAMSMATERGLLASGEIQGLFSARNPDAGNLLARQTVNIEIASSLNSVLDVAFTLEYLPFINLSANIRTAIEKKMELKVHWEIEF